MRGTLVLSLLLVPAMAGCLDAETLFSEGSLRSCDKPTTFTLYLGPQLSLVDEMPESGVTTGNGFNEAFVSNNMDEWHGPFSQRTWRITGDVELELWTRGINTPAPVVIGGDPGDAYHFFNQFGTNRGFVESYAVEYASALPNDDVHHYTQVFAMPEGGVLLEKGDYVRLLLTNLVLDDPETGAGPEILWGEHAPSRITYQATCERNADWLVERADDHTIVIPAHQGLLTGAVPAEEGVNFQDVPLSVTEDTGRLTIRLLSATNVGPKSDMDVVVLTGTGEENWSIGSPYTDEIGTRWRANLDASMPPGQYTIRVNSYSGHAYLGTVLVTHEVRA